jgi:hypothetical protein
MPRDGTILRMRRTPRPEQIEVVDDAVAEVLRRNGGAKSVEMIASAWRFMHDVLDRQIRTKHPSWPDAQVAAEVRRRLLNGST